jgi:hypothetical protein
MRAFEGGIPHCHFEEAVTERKHIDTFSTVRSFFIDFRSHITFCTLLRSESVWELLDQVARTEVDDFYQAVWIVQPQVAIEHEVQKL